MVCLCCCLLFAQHLLGQAGSVSFNNASCTELEASVTLAPSEAGYMLVLSENSIDFNPVDGVAYPFNADFGAGPDISPLNDGEYVVYFGAASATILGLNPGQTYQYVLYPYISANGAPIYSLSTPIQGAVTTATGLVVESEINNATCRGFNDGSVDINILSGTAPFDFTLNSVIFFPDSATATMQNVGPLAPGSFVITVADALGCSTLITGEVLEPDTLDIFLLTLGNVSCFGGNDGFAEFDVSTGALTGSTLTYSFDSTLDIDTTTYNTYAANNLPAGSYEVIIAQDGNNACADTLQWNIIEPAAITLGDVVIVEPSCGSGEDGSISVGINGGTGDYTTTWIDESGATVSFGSDVTDIPAGTYMLNVEDENGCAIDTVITVEEDLIGCITAENIPTVITPNGDSFNDSWFINGLDRAYPNNVVTICNRWGDPVYERDACPSNCWDGVASGSGEELPAGTYFYVIQLDPDADPDAILKGAINLLR